MSETRLLNFRRVETQPASEDSAVVRRPAWMRADTAQIRPAPFAGGEDSHEPEPSAHQQRIAPQAQSSQSHSHTMEQEQRLVPDPGLASLRRSSFPARKSVFPPAVVISRLPPPPVIEEEPKISAQQEAFAQAALDLGSLRARVLSTVEQQLLQLSVQIAQSIIEREVSLDPSLYCTLAKTAVLALGDTQSARVRVSRTAYKAISELYGEAAIDVDGVRVEVSMDASYEGLSVVAEAGPSRVDSKLSERLSAVLRAMEAEHRRNNAVLDTEEPQ